jgi:hypothetical protein
MDINALNMLSIAKEAKMTMMLPTVDKNLERKMQTVI